MKAIGIIPARYASTRLPGKILLDINGKPLIQRVWENAKRSKKLEDLLIVCDHQKVFDVAQSFGAKVMMSDPGLLSGTDRVAYAAEKLDTEIIVNIQGDEPMLFVETIDRLINVLDVSDDAVMSTVVKSVKDVELIKDPNIVKVILDNNDNAVYFSRNVIPYLREEEDKDNVVYYKHFGIYAYKKDFLLEYTKLSQTMLERSEKLEQLRAIENGYKIKVIKTETDSVGVDTFEDLEKVRELLK